MKIIGCKRKTPKKECKNYCNNCTLNYKECKTKMIRFHKIFIIGDDDK